MGLVASWDDVIDIGGDRVDVLKSRSDGLMRAQTFPPKLDKSGTLEDASKIDILNLLAWKMWRDYGCGWMEHVRYSVRLTRIHMQPLVEIEFNGKIYRAYGDQITEYKP